MKNKPSSLHQVDQNRRLINLALWTAPVISAVSLPAHAQTSGDVSPTSDDQASVSYFGLSLKQSFPNGGGDNAGGVNACIELANASATSAEVSLQVETSELKGTIPTNGDFGFIDEVATGASCAAPVANALEVAVISLTASSVQLRLRFGNNANRLLALLESEVTVPQSPCGDFPALLSCD